MGSEPLRLLEHSMRIFCLTQATPNEGDLPTSKLWHANLCLPLVDLGHELITFSDPWLSRAYFIDFRNTEHCNETREERPRFSERLINEVKTEHQRKPIDLFFSYFSSAHAEPDAIRQIGQMGIVTVNWYCNASYQFHNVAEIAPAYHYCLVPEKFRLEDYRRAGANPIYCQEAANPHVYQPYDLPSEYDVTFVGQKYGTRPYYIRHLIDAGIDARVWGPGWKPAPGLISVCKTTARRAKNFLLNGMNDKVPELPATCCGPPLTDDELIRMYSRSKVSLGFTSVAEIPADGSAAIKQVRLRDFEATMSGAFYLVEYVEELIEFFEPDREIVFFQDAPELVDKSRYYLAHDEARQRIRLAGMQRARTEHTWHKRFQTVFQKIGLS